MAYMWRQPFAWAGFELDTGGWESFLPARHPRRLLRPLDQVR
jgi:hypothetical protein